MPANSRWDLIRGLKGKKKKKVKGPVYVNCVSTENIKMKTYSSSNHYIFITITLHFQVTYSPTALWPILGPWPTVARVSRVKFLQLRTSAP